MASLQTGSQRLQTPLCSEAGESNTWCDGRGFSNKVIKAVRRYHEELWSTAEAEAALAEPGP